MFFHSHFFIVLTIYSKRFRPPTLNLFLMQLIKTKGKKLWIKKK